MKLIFIIFILGNYNCLCQDIRQYAYESDEIRSLYWISFIRKINNLKPLKPNGTLNHFASLVSKRLQTKNIDTVIPNTLILFYNDSLPNFNQNIIKEDYELVGLDIKPHQTKCMICVITFDKKKPQVWKEQLTCPSPIKNRK